MRTLRLFALALFGGLAGLLPSCRSQAEVRAPASARASVAAIVEPRRWQHEVSDIPVDPRIRFGSLANGFRYAWMSNREPHERCYVRLHVDVGSLAEEDSERGLAHFLEHMAFNGTRDYPGTSVIEWFQRHGMGFGADSNAQTSFSQTVYMLDLPKSDATTIAEGLHVLREFADGLTIAPAEVEDEKGVVDAEERERDSAGWRAQREHIERMLAGTLAAERLPIGVKEVRDRFDAGAVRAFYEKWYRPDLMTLVLVGDLGDIDPSALIAEAFASMKVPSSPRPAEPALGTPTFADVVFAIHEPELPTERISVQRLAPYEERPATIVHWVEDVPLEYARSMLDLRFLELAKKADAPFLGAGAGDAEFLRALDGEELTIACRPERWRDALIACELELRRALEFGFQEAELAEVRSNALRTLDESVERESTRSSSSYASAILHAAEDPSVPANAATVLDIVRPAVQALTVERCVEAFRAAWRSGVVAITAVGALDLAAEASTELRAGWEAGQAIALEAPASITAANFAYLAGAEPGAIASREHRDDLDLEEVRFENGVRLFVKRTDFKERQILFDVRIGEGQLAVAPEAHAVAWVLEQVFVAGGLGEHSADELRRVMAGKQVSGEFTLSSDAFELSGETTADDFLLQCELVCAHILDPGWRAEGLSQFQKNLPQFYEGLKHQHEGPLLLEFLPLLYGGDSRFTIPTQAQAEAVTRDDLQSFFMPVLADAPITVAVVGDLAIEDVIAAAARTFGVLPARRALERFEERRQVDGPRPGLLFERAIDTTIGKTLVLAVLPTTDGFDPVVRRNLSFLGGVYNDRLRIEVREKLGASYSPSASGSTSTVWRGDGAVSVQATANPPVAKELLEACLAVAGELARGGVTDEEVDRLREPLLNQLRDARRRNGHWLDKIADAHGRPEALVEILTAEDHYRSVRASDLTPLAERYLPPERASVMIVSPKE